MGVSGLLPLLKSIHKHTTLKKYAGQTLGVDAFGWLHRGAVVCALDLALNRPTTQYIDFVVRRVRMLIDFGVIPYLVFDGDSAPSKAGTNGKRRKERDAAKELGLSLYRTGKKDQAFQELQKAVTITPQMTHAVIERLRQMKIQVLVAPYEADAQLTYLEKEGIIDGIISEDSDLLVFGAKRLITKLDANGLVIEINRSDFVLNKDINLAGWSDTMFRRMAILSGCDYLPSINGIGLKKGHEFVKKHKDIAKIARVIALQGKFVVPPDYVAGFLDAERSFLYHRVFCPKAGKMVFLNPLPPGLQDLEMPYLGSYVEPDVIIGVACGDLDPKTKKPFTDLCPSTSRQQQRPMLQESRRQTIGDMNDLKAKKSIESFFKPYRPPLAELDPNSLTPSPSQQRVLERNSNASWEPRHVHSAPALRRSVTNLPPQSPLLSNGHEKNAQFLARAGALSTYKPVKRQRLCSEGDGTSPSQENKQSKYFTPNIMEQSPLMSKKSRSRKSLKNSFDVFSDDSVENIMLELQQNDEEVQGQVVTYPELPKLSSLDDASPEAEASEDDRVPQSSPVKHEQTQLDSQSSHGTIELQGVSIDSQHEEVVPQLEVNKNRDPAGFQKLLEFHVQELNKSVGARKSASYTFQSQSRSTQLAALATVKSPSSITRSTRTTISPHSNDDTAEPEAEHVVSPSRVSRIKFQSLTRTFACQSPDVQGRALRSLSGSAKNSITVQELSVPHTFGSEDVIPFSSSPRTSDVDDPTPKSVHLREYTYLGT